MTITAIRTRGAALRVARTDIRFRNVSFERVRIEITVTNRGDAPSPPTPMRVEAAHLGAFLPWRPLAERVVPPVPPGGTHTVRFEAARPEASPVARLDVRSGRVEDLSSGGLVTAVAGGDGRPSGLPGDLFQLLGRGRLHWAGNLNVFLGSERVERHRAPALRVHAGRPNAAMFCLGEKPDAYCLDLQGEGAAWEAGLLLIGERGTRRGMNLHACGGPRPIEPGRWIRLDGTAMVLLAVMPPAGAVRGALDVHVRQRSSGETAVVEFDLDPRAAGPGCFTV